jgi:ADP-ribosylglycohydrolase
MKRNQDAFKGCLIGGAVGDALGWPVEFMKLDEIIRRYGHEGITELQTDAHGVAEITDDTQMTLFTAEGILRAETRGNQKGICHPPAVVYYAYQRWLITQGYPKFDDYDWIYDGWLLGVKELHARRAPGNTCLSALLNKKPGSSEVKINDSKGCGGVMRVAPAGMFYPKEEAFEMAVDFAALTHGHPSGYLSSGALAYMIALIVEGADIEIAVNETMAKLERYEGHEECTESLSVAVKLAKSGIPDTKAVKQIGEGWIAEEALAISVYCALKYHHDFKAALMAAVNHDGDSDSTGAITGNILGAYLGLNQIPEEWVKKVELNNVLMQVADDLLIGYQDTDEWWERYPGY